MTRWPSQLVRYSFKNSYGGKFLRRVFSLRILHWNHRGSKEESKAIERGIGDFIDSSVCEHLERDLSFLCKEDVCQGCVGLQETACTGWTVRRQSYFPERVSAVESEKAVGLTSHTLCYDTVSQNSPCYLCLPHLLPLVFSTRNLPNEA